jgi:hypothetical protein
VGETFRLVRSVKGSAQEVWARILQARTFVVSPRPRFGVKLLQDADLHQGEHVLARLTIGPILLPETWMVETHDRDDRRMELRGAEGFEDELLWDHQISIGEAGGGRSIIEYHLKAPRRRRFPFGIQPRPVFERRHMRFRAQCHAGSPQWPVF